MAERLKSAFTAKWMVFILGILLGALVILGIRYFTYKPAETHYHANFAVYIDGRREQFKSPQYYQEVSICALHGLTPLARAHMHDNVNSVVHVHDDAVTWGQFFDNLGWEIGPDFIHTTDKLYAADDSNKLNIVLNGHNLTGLTNITNQVIGDKDRLLVSYGDIGKSELNKEFASVPSTAARYDSQKDPASCSGPDALTPAERLKHLL